MSGSRRGSEDTEESVGQRVTRIQLTKEAGGGLGLSIGSLVTSCKTYNVNLSDPSCGPWWADGEARHLRQERGGG